MKTDYTEIIQINSKALAIDIHDHDKCITVSLLKSFNSYLLHIIEININKKLFLMINDQKQKTIQNF